MNGKKIFLYFCIVVMLLFAYFQLNDPDPHIWIPIYLVVAFLSYRKLKFQDEKLVFLIPAFLFFVWGVSLFPPHWEGVLLNEIGMKTINIELGRESFGLFINTFLLIIFAFIPSHEK